MKIKRFEDILKDKDVDKDTLYALRSPGTKSSKREPFYNEKDSEMFFDDIDSSSLSDEDKKIQKGFENIRPSIPEIKSSPIVSKSKDMENWPNNRDLSRSMNNIFKKTMDFFDSNYGENKKSTKDEDEETPKKIESLETLDGETIYFSNKGKDKFRSSFKSSFFNNDKSNSVKEMKDNPKLAKELLDTIKHLSTIISSSRKYLSEPDTKENKDNHKGVFDYSTFMAPIKINGQKRKVMFKIRNTISPGDGLHLVKPFYYYHWLEESKNIYIPVICDFSFLD